MTVVLIFFVCEQDSVVDTVVCATLEPDTDGVRYYDQKENGSDAGDRPGAILEGSGGLAFDGGALLECCGESCRHR